METSLHRQLKEIYADDTAQIEVPVGRYRIDVLRGDELIEIQHGALAAIRDKVAALLAKNHRLLVVKPIIVRKRLIKHASRGGKIIGRRFSPKRGNKLGLFDELVHFTRVFPHENLTIETPMVETDELRFPGHGKRRRYRPNDHQVEDQRLTTLLTTHRYAKTADLVALLPTDLPQEFDTAELAQQLDVDRAAAQRIAYCLREMGAVRTIGRRKRAWLYELPAERRRPSLATLSHP